MTIGYNRYLTRCLEDKMKLDIEDIIKILDKELKWCFDNPDKTFHKEYRKGFTNGLIQAKYLMVELELKIKKEHWEKYL